MNKYNNFQIEDLGVCDTWVYDIEVEDNHNFFANNILVHNSNYIWLEELYNACDSGKSFLDFCLEFEKTIFEPFLVKILKEYSDSFNTESILHFKREKIILKQYVEAKKNYMTFIIANEKKIYKEPTLKLTGGSIVKSDLAKFSKSSLKKLGEMMFVGDSPNNKNMLNHIKLAQKEFLKLHINDISTPKGLGDYEKYEVELDNTFDNFVSKTPIHNRAAIIYNKVIKDRHLPYVEIKSGTKLKFIYVHPNNPYKTDVVGFVGNWPKEFDNIFKVDFETQFEKQYLNVAQRIFDTLGFGKIVLKESKLSKLIID